MFIISPAPSSAFTPPRQKRSRDRLEAILTALESLLRTRLFEDVAVTEIAKTAQVPVGTIYQRFENKEAMLPALFARHHESVVTSLAPLLESLKTEPRLENRVRQLVHFAVDYHRKHQGLLRALTVYSRGKTDDIPPQVFKERREQYRHVARLMIGRGQGVAHRSKLDNAVYALGVINSICREQLLFGDASPTPPAETQGPAFERRLVKLILNYLA